MSTKPASEPKQRYEYCPTCWHVRLWDRHTFDCDGLIHYTSVQGYTGHRGGARCGRWMHEGTALQYSAFLLGGPEAVKALGPPHAWEVPWVTP